MTDDLLYLINLKDQIVEKHSDSITIEIVLDSVHAERINSFYEQNLIENIKDDTGKIINTEQLNSYISKTLRIEFVSAELERLNFYIDLNNFISKNRFRLPTDFFIAEIEFSDETEEPNEKFNKYKTTTKLINNLISKAKFSSDENIKTLYFVQENSLLELPIDNIVYEDFLDSENLISLEEYADNIESYKEKRSIFIKELIDFLSEIKTTDKFQHLLINFSDFYNRCNSSYEYYLANFSFNKVKLELDNSVLEHSKNIRAIINDSQSKLIALPAAFVLAATQIDFNNTFIIKNIIIVISSFLFSYIISIFIKNQKHAIAIVSDNVGNYKNNYQRSKSNIFETEQELKTLIALINNAYKKTEEELEQQKKSLKILQTCNWGISISLLILLLLAKYFSTFLDLLYQSISFCQYSC